MQRLNIDTIGPLPPDEAGNRYIIVIIDTFSRWVELYPCDNVKANAAAKALYQHFGRFGAPEQVLSDKGSQYTASLVKRFLQLVGTQQLTTKAYSKEENASVERANKDVMKYIRAICYDTNTKAEWSDNLPIVQRIMNSLKKDVTGFSPAELLYGTALTLNANLFDLKECEEIIETPINEWLAKRAQQQLKALAVARKAQEQHDLAHTEATVAEVTSYSVGDWVLKDYPRSVSGANGRPNKLFTNAKGPYKIVEKLSDQEYILQDANNHLLEPVSVHLLRNYKYDATRVDPSKEGFKDSETWEVEHILSHTGAGKNPRFWKFKVKWQDYAHIHNTDEVWKNLINNGMLHQYLTKRKLEKYIPEKYRGIDE